MTDRAKTDKELSANSDAEALSGIKQEMNEIEEEIKRQSEPSGDPEADAQNKLNHLLFCGNDRVELSAAKEILAMAEKNSDDSGEIKLDVTIKIV